MWEGFCFCLLLPASSKKSHLNFRGWPVIVCYAVQEVAVAGIGINKLWRPLVWVPSTRLGGLRVQATMTKWCFGKHHICILTRHTGGNWKYALKSVWVVVRGMWADFHLSIGTSPSSPSPCSLMNSHKYVLGGHSILWSRFVGALGLRGKPRRMGILIMQVQVCSAGCEPLTVNGEIQENRRQLFGGWQRFFFLSDRTTDSTFLHQKAVRNCRRDRREHI